MDAFADWLMSYLNAFGQWLVDGLDYVLVMAVSSLVDGVLSVFNGLGAMLPGALGSTPPAIVGGVAWAVAPLQLASGLSLIGSAYLVRFLIRRLPVVG